MKSSLTCCLVAAPLWLLAASVAAGADLTQLVQAAAAGRSGQSTEPWRELEKLVAKAAANPAARAEVEGALIRLLAPTSSYEARRFACQQLAIVGAESSVSPLASLLANEETVTIACVALRTNPSAQASAALRQACPSLRGPARVQVINTLGDRQDAGAVKLLSELARGADKSAAAAAIVALGKIGTEPARAAVAGLRKEADPAVAAAVVEASLRIAESLAGSGNRAAAIALYETFLQPTQPAGARRGALAALFVLDKDGGVQRILQVLQGADSALKPVAIAAVRTSPATAASETFAHELTKLPAQEQVWMIEALAGRGDLSARSAIRARLDAEDPSVRLASIAALGAIDDASGVPLLARTLAGTRAREESAAIEQALVSLVKGPETDRAILAELPTASPGAKACLMSALARRGSRAAVPALFQEASGLDPAVVSASFLALGRLASPEELPLLLDKLATLRADGARGAAEDALIQALLKVSDLQRRSEAVRAALSRAGDLAARSSLLRLLPHCPDALAFASLKSSLSATEPSLRETALRTMTEWPDLAAWGTLVDLYRQPDSESHRVLALRALVRLVGEENARPNARLVERYRQLLAGARNDDDRRLILGALGGALQPDALQLAVEMRATPGLRAEVELAVRKIADAIKAQFPQAAQEALAGSVPIISK